MKTVSMIYFCIFTIVVTTSGVSMMFYACLKRQGYLINFMHVLWNIIRFFIFSFFLFGTAYGVVFLILSDLISCMHRIFNENLIKEKNKGDEFHFLYNCLFSEKEEHLKFLDEIIKIKVINFYSATTCGSEDTICQNLKKKANEESTIGSFDCSFLKSDLNHLYKALDDASWQSQYLSAICLCSSFFGAIAVYFYLLVMHHYNNELFFDVGKSIFTGFDSFGFGYKKKKKNEDPAYKKRKLRAEIELTSKNEEESP